MSLNQESKSKKAQRVRALLRGSSIEVNFVPNEYLRISFYGAAAKVPSVSNNRLAMIPKERLFSLLRSIMAAQNPPQRMGLVKSAMSTLKQMRPVITKNNDHVEQLLVMSLLWKQAKPKDFVPFLSSMNERLFVFLFCGEELRLHDTHNINKAACDWLQEEGVFKNDRNVDAIALRASDYGLHGTTLVVVPQNSFFNFSSKSLKRMFNNLINEVLYNDRSLQRRETRTVPAQQTLSLSKQRQAAHG